MQWWCYIVAAAVTVISVSVCLRKRKNKHVNTTDNVAYHCSGGPETIILKSMKPMLKSVILASTLLLMMHMASLLEHVMSLHHKMRHMLPLMVHVSPVAAE